MLTLQAILRPPTGSETHWEGLFPQLNNETFSGLTREDCLRQGQEKGQSWIDQHYTGPQSLTSTQTDYFPRITDIKETFTFSDPRAPKDTNITLTATQGESYKSLRIIAPTTPILVTLSPDGHIRDIMPPRSVIHALPCQDNESLHMALKPLLLQHTKEDVFHFTSSLFLLQNSLPWLEVLSTLIQGGVVIEDSAEHIRSTSWPRIIQKI